MQNTEENILELQEVIRRETPRLLRIPGVKNIAVALKYRNGHPTDTLCIRVTIKEIKIEEAQGQNGLGQNKQQSAIGANQSNNQATNEIARKKEQKLQEIKSQIRLSGYPVDVVEVGDVTELPGDRECPVPVSEARTGTYDELKGGIAIYAEVDGAKQRYGTLGMIVYDATTFSPLILTTRDIIDDILFGEAGDKNHNEFIFQGDKTKVGFNLRSDFKTSVYKKESSMESNFLVAEISDESNIFPHVLDIPFERILLEPQWIPGKTIHVWKSGSRTGNTEGIITKIYGSEFNVIGIDGKKFACNGDTGAIVFGEKDGIKRPMGIVTSYYENLEVRCVSLKNAFINNKWLNICLSFDRSGDMIHEFNNEKDKAVIYGSLNNIDINQRQPEYVYGKPAFLTYDENQKSIILYRWYNPYLKKQFYSTDISAEGKIQEGYFLSNIISPVNIESSEGLVELQRVKNTKLEEYRLSTSDESNYMSLLGYNRDIVNGYTYNSNVKFTQVKNKKNNYSQPKIFVKRKVVPTTLVLHHYIQGLKGIYLQKKGKTPQILKNIYPWVYTADELTPGDYVITFEFISHIYKYDIYFPKKINLIIGFSRIFSKDDAESVIELKEIMSKFIKGEIYKKDLIFILSRVRGENPSYSEINSYIDTYIDVIFKKSTFNLINHKRKYLAKDWSAAMFKNLVKATIFMESDWHQFHTGRKNKNKLVLGNQNPLDIGLGQLNIRGLFTSFNLANCAVDWKENIKATASHIFSNHMVARGVFSRYEKKAVYWEFTGDNLIFASWSLYNQGYQNPYIKKYKFYDAYHYFSTNIPLNKSFTNEQWDNLNKYVQDQKIIREKNNNKKK